VTEYMFWSVDLCLVRGRKSPCLLWLYKEDSNPCDERIETVNWKRVFYNFVSLLFVNLSMCRLDA